MSLPQQRVDRRALTAFLVVMLFSAFLCLFRLGDRAFRNPDEGRYALASSEMAQSGDWVQPTLYGLKYLKKPILFYWMVSASFKLFGSSELTARMVPSFFCWLGVGFVFWFTRHHYGLQCAVLSALMLATNIWYLNVGRYLVIDAVFSFFISSAMFSFFMGLSSVRKKGWYLGFYALVALAFLAKGLIALALPALAIGTYLIFTRTLVKTIRESRLALGAIIFLGVAGPWYVLMQIRDPGFLSFFFFHEHWERFVSSGFEHQEPWFYYAAILPLLLFPWSLLWRPFVRVWPGRTDDVQRDPRLYLFVWAVVMLVFFSLSRAKLPTYILPCLAPVVILISVGWNAWIESNPKLGKTEILGVGLLAMSAIGIVVGGTWFVTGPSQKFPAGIDKNLQMLGGGLLAFSVVALRAIQRQRTKQLFFTLVIAMAFCSVSLIGTMETMNTPYSTKVFAQFLQPRIQSNETVYIYDHPGPFYDFAFYLQRPVKLVGLEGELEFSRDDRRAGEVSVTKEAFQTQLREGKFFYCLIRRSDFEELEPVLKSTLKILKQDARKILFVSGLPENGIS